ncbi:ATP-dependent RNA helicase DBP7 [Lepidopterella palustris CBS 459.81]|uniref:ATP-dependent RNA helicase n=1 Tax=Lepidopterella palustris CBS 459.81 TaxID=1314670 RepID=A0A8E2E8B0_9PEZI|nr:ATP-dependent RNA helicase DBP7 [Lepidopterella palustris CBS 459.81]
MADDGMLLNFFTSDAVVPTIPTFKGGRWKDRLTAKKAAQHWQKKVARGPNTPSRTNSSGANTTQITRRQNSVESDQSEAHNGTRSTKRPRVSGEFRPTSNGPFAQNGTKAHAGGNETYKAGPKQVISSLFTYNPTSITKTIPQNEPQNETPVEPSNAPLTSELDTFTSLGLSATLASHLLKKMELKAPTAIQKAAITQLVKEDSDAFIQAETGSGKTLAYLLPIVQRIMDISANIKKRKVEEGPDAIHRDSGLFAIILAPTRELSKQIALVLESLLRCAHWIVAGTVTGGESKKSEKARLRKGFNILVATPGRLADHLENTERLDVSNVRWLVLDEGDRLMELGFEQEIQKIVGNLNLRMRAKKDPKLIIPGLPARRTTILCSATMKMDVQRLGEISLKEAVHIHADPADQNEEDVDRETKDQAFFAPAQLKQSYATVPAKLRLVSLIAFLKRAFARKGSVMKAIVFISCADSVDFHFDVLTSQLDLSSTPAQVDEPSPPSDPEKQSESKSKSVRLPPQSNPTTLTVTHAPSPLLSPTTHTVTTYRLHGSLPQALRTSTLAHFTTSTTPSLLIATDVASRGLDLPNVDLVIEFDPAFAREDHLHRIGRTARAGRDGRACIFLMPGCEEGYVDVLKGDRKDGEAAGLYISRQDADEVLKKGLQPDPSTSQPAKGGSWSGSTAKSKTTRLDKISYADKATQLQLDIERWVLASPSRLESARRAYQSHIRAYATHVAAERKFFDIKELHLGHLAKAFALRERPSGMKVPGLRTGVGRAVGGKVDGKKDKGVGKGVSTRKETKAAGGGGAGEEAEEAAKMRKAVRAREKFMRGAGGAEEFNLG